VFPIGDQNEPGRGPAYVTLLLIAINLAVFFLIQSPEADNPAQPFTYGYSAIPAEITHGIDLVRPEVITVDGQRMVVPEAPGPDPIYLTLITSLFMHAGLIHLFGNMLFLWIFGDNVEHRLGHLRYLLFYLAAGVVATLAQVAATPDSVIPTLGASGAISGVLGAYLVLFPHNRVTIVVLRFIPYRVPAIVAIGMWAVFQLLSSVASPAGEVAGGVAYLAHIGGFVFGVVVGLLVRSTGIGGNRPRYAWR